MDGGNFEIPRSKHDPLLSLVPIPLHFSRFVPSSPRLPSLYSHAKALQASWKEKGRKRCKIYHQNTSGEVSPSQSITIQASRYLFQIMSILQKQYHDKLKMELQCVQYSPVSNVNKQTSAEDAEAREDSLPDMQQIAEDSANMSKVVMSRKKRRLYEAMQIGKERKQGHVDLLKNRKKRIEEAN
ncbi:hypothetical protein F0562_004597 [Nyssa sinensis]|uniref:Uncharacterized protein n=1 Tax=Nyssa sinensis TaxID=561372 RepID=A0A5J5C2M9_9ASTE|nr:hypothetical protein F0562_004597 [Nyssa sinensis]